METVVGKALLRLIEGRVTVALAATVSYRLCFSSDDMRAGA
jgi:hypothetical protein